MSDELKVLILYPHNDPLDPQNHAARYGAGDLVVMTKDQLQARREAMLARFTSDPYHVEGEVKESAFGGEIAVPKLEPGAEVHLGDGVRSMLRAEDTLRNLDATLAKDPQLVAEGYKPETAQPFETPAEPVVADDAPVAQPLTELKAETSELKDDVVTPVTAEATGTETTTVVETADTQPPAQAAEAAPAVEAPADAAAETQVSAEELANAQAANEQREQAQQAQAEAAPAVEAQADTQAEAAPAVEAPAEAAPAADATPVVEATPVAEPPVEAPAKKKGGAKKQAEPAPQAE